MKYYYRFILLFVVLMIGSLVHAQEPSANTDSLNSEKDSLVRALLGQIQELQMQSIMMREQLEKSGQQHFPDERPKLKQCAHNVDFNETCVDIGRYWCVENAKSNVSPLKV